MIVSGVFGLGQGADTGNMPTPFFGSGQMQQPFFSSGQGQRPFASSSPSWSYLQYPTGGGGYYPPYQQEREQHAESRQLRQQLDKERNHK